MLVPRRMWHSPGTGDSRVGTVVSMSPAGHGTSEWDIKGTSTSPGFMTPGGHGALRTGDIWVETKPPFPMGAEMPAPGWMWRCPGLSGSDGTPRGHLCPLGTAVRGLGVLSKWGMLGWGQGTSISCGCHHARSRVVEAEADGGHQGGHGPPKGTRMLPGCHSTGPGVNMALPGDRGHPRGDNPCGATLPAACQRHPSAVSLSQAAGPDDAGRLHDVPALGRR